MNTLSPQAGEMIPATPNEKTIDWRTWLIAPVQRQRPWFFPEDTTLHSLRLIAPALAMALTACNGSHADAPFSSTAAGPGKPATPIATPGQAEPPSQTTGTPGNAPIPDVSTFVPAGMKVVDALRGDLTGAGHSDALLVLSPPSTGQEKLGEGEPRTVLLIVQDASGALQKAAENSRIVPCTKCGGLAGDPYAFSHIEKGLLTITISGGSRERWYDNFVFRYAADRKTWLLEKVVRGVSDMETEQHKEIELTTKDFGDVTFAQFDPATLTRTATLE